MAQPFDLARTTVEEPRFAVRGRGAVFHAVAVAAEDGVAADADAAEGEAAGEFVDCGCCEACGNVVVAVTCAWARPCAGAGFGSVGVVVTVMGVGSGGYCRLRCRRVGTRGVFPGRRVEKLAKVIKVCLLGAHPVERLLSGGGEGSAL